MDTQRFARSPRLSRSETGPSRFGFAGLSSQLDGLIQNVEHELRIRSPNAHRRRDANRLPPKTAFAEQEPVLASMVEHSSTFFPRRFFRGAVPNQFDSQQQALSADIADQRVLQFEFLKPGEEIVSDPQRVFLKVFLSMTSKTAFPAAAATGLPPNVLK